MVTSVDQPTVTEFREAALAWLLQQRALGLAPDDWGPILPPDRRDDGVAWQRRIHDAGFAGLACPPQLGGAGLTPDHEAAWLEECGRAGVPAVLNMVGLVLAVRTLLSFGTPAQQQMHIPPTLTGERIWCQLFSEPGAGSDLASMTTRATADGDGWVVSGHKVWSSGARISDRALLLARSNPDVARHAGISMFVLDLGSDGVEIRPLRQMTGGSEFDEVFLTDVVLPPESLLGPLHGGWGVAMSALTNERGFIGSAVTGMGRRIDALCASARPTAGSDPAPDASYLAGPDQDRIARLYARARALRALRDRQGPGTSVASSLLKLGMTELSYDLAMTSLDLAGFPATGAGPLAAAVLAAPGARLGGGTSEIQRTIIGERVLGLPPEPRPST
ncbi:MAG: acyl-CoA dehydrogenase [Acidimicrobiales bacterium]